MKVPIAETFHSIQGEGFHTGVPMFFIRLAGCTVGRKVRKARLDDPPGLKLFKDVIIGHNPLLPSGKEAWVCHTYDDRPFWCDTDFNKYEELDSYDLVKEAYERHICLTGGEPLMHREVVDDIARIVLSERKLLHIESSGTIAPWFYNSWLAVSPKLGVLPEAVKRANEIKLLIGPGFDLAKVPGFILEHPHIYVQPINDISRIKEENVKRCMELLRQFPTWRLSIQLHKLIGVR